MKKLLIIFLVLSCAGACKEAYDPPVISTNHSFLVVEGFINSGPDSTVIRLSRTAKLNDAAAPAPETGATVTIEGSDGSTYLIQEISPGKYSHPFLLNPGIQCRLHIVTSAGKEYRSDFVPIKTSPPIDSINWKQVPEGIEIYANTHDPQNASTYYLWNYSETWEFHSVYFSQFEYDPVLDTLVPRPVDTFYYCWQGDLSNNILLGSSQKLAQDVIYEAPLVMVPQNSWHISVEYSILVRQYVLTADAYNFWLNLQRNTEQIGSVFSPQPSEIKGNIHSLSDSTEQVVGYISAGTLSEKRLFITPDQIPNWTGGEYPNACYKVHLTAIPDSLQFFLGPQNTYIPIGLADKQPLFPPLIYDIAEKPCVDCTQTGTNHKPDFWP
jgi:hypothetical protein